MTELLFDQEFGNFIFGIFQEDDAIEEIQSNQSSNSSHTFKSQSQVMTFSKVSPELRRGKTNEHENKFSAKKEYFSFDPSKKNPSKRQRTSVLKLMRDAEAKRLKSSQHELVQRLLFPNDNRLSYHRVIVEAFNSASHVQLEKTLHSFCVTDCKFKSFVKSNRSVMGINHREITGVKNIASFLNMYHVAMPDAVLDNRDFFIKKFDLIPEDFSKYPRHLVYDSPKTVLESHYCSENLLFFIPCTLTGTRLCDIITEQRSVVNSHEPSSEPAQVEITLKHLANPIQVNITGDWLIILNRDNRIIRIEMHLD